MEKYINGISELCLGKKITSGSCGSIYKFADGIYFKEVNEDYMCLDDVINLEFYEVIKYLSEINDMPFVVRALDTYRSKGNFFGYTMPVVFGDELGVISDDVFVSDLINSFYKLIPDIRKLSDNFVKTEDIGGDNILYNGNMYLLDLDLSLVDRRYIPDELYVNTSYSVFRTILSRVLGEVNDEELFQYKNGNRDNYREYINKIVDSCSEFSGREVKTIGDVGKIYRKFKKAYKV